MRTTGVNFARGSCCRALKWMAPRRMALFGVVFALGAGSASAQLTISDPKTVNEGNVATFNVTVKWRQVAGASVRNIVVDGTGAVHFPANLAPSSTITGGAARQGSSNALTEAELSVGGQPDDFTADLVALTITVPANTSSTTTTGTITRPIQLLTGSDLDAEDEALQVTFTVVPDGAVGQDGAAIAAPDPATRDIRIEDNQEQSFRWVDVPDDAAEGGGPYTFKIDAAYPGNNLGWETSLFANEGGYSFGANPAVEVVDEADVNLTPPTNDGNRTDDTVTVRGVLSGTRSDLPGLDPIELTFKDLHTLPDADKITAQAYEDNGRGARTTKTTDSATEGGDRVHVRVTIDRGTNGYPTGEDLQVSVQAASSAQAGDFRLQGAPVTIGTGTGKQNADFMLWALADNDIGDETLTLNLVTTGKTAANGTGSVVGTFSIEIVDATEAQVEPKAAAAVETAVMGAMGSAPLNPGGDFMVDASELFTYDASAVDVTYTAAVEGDAASVSTSGDMVTVLARQPGDATVTVTAHATTKASSAVSTSQTVANTASVSFDVTVVLADLEVTLSRSPDDDNITEGMSVTLTATANRAVTADMTVRLSGTGGTASPNDYSVENITIEEGETVGTTMLMATTDDMAERSETLELTGYLGNMKLEPTFEFTIWDAAVPALPVIAQLLLAAFLAIGGYRRYLRRR